ncbi:MAG: hypothetical protein M1839_002404 [Geoglossum umbratile]|nr:MAG: hypothetical protein M1839_002404 [Geoglossum umbratile]
MAIKVYGIPYSTCTMRVIMVLKEKGVEYEVIPIDLSKGQHKSKTPEHMKNQPFGQIPFIDDDGYILYESRAICRYIALKYADQGTPLMPLQTDLKALGLFEQAVSVEMCHFDAWARMLVSEKVFKPKFHGQPTDEEAAAKYKLELSKRLDVYEKLLSTQAYTTGDSVSLVDIFHLPYGALLGQAGAGELITERPHVKAWWDRVSARESWKSLSQGA